VLKTYAQLSTLGHVMLLQASATLINMSAPPKTQSCFISCHILLHIYKQNEINVKLAHFQMIQTKKKIEMPDFI